MTRKAGDAGASRLDRLEMPMHWSVPVADGTQFFGNVDLVRLDAGRGRRASGTAIAVGIQTPQLRIDVGTTPIGFEHADFVGGLLWQGQGDALEWKWHASRRAVTDSLLSHAGMLDAPTGRFWGAVRRTSAGFHLMWKREPVSPVVSLELAAYRGRGVRANHARDLAVGARAVLVDRPDFHASVSPTLGHLSFDNNQNVYQPGSGGYYSPQSRVVLSAPLLLTARQRAWSLSARTNLSFAHSRTDAAKRESAAGASADITLEYLAAPRWVLGGRLTADRSRGYALNQLQFFVRWTDDARTQARLWPQGLPRATERTP